MVIAWIYKSLKIDEMYLYLPNKDDFSGVPEALTDRFGKAQFVMMVKLNERDKLARVDIESVRKGLADNGYYLQMPPNKNDPLIKSQLVH